MQRRSVRNLKKTLTLAHIALAWAMVPAEAQVSYESAESVYEQNFDGLPSTGSTFTWTDNETIPGWYAGNSAGTSFNPAGISTGSTTTGDLYSFGSSGSTDRALGSIGSGTVGNMWWGVQLVNTTGETITAFTLSYTGEQWRRASMEQQAISVEYSLTATALKTGTYQAIPALTFISPDTGGSNGARDGNQSAYRTSIGPVTVNNIHWAPGEALWIRFFDPDHTGSDHGLAIDDFSFSVAEASSSYDPPSGYYDSAQGLSGDVLAGALRDIVSPHTVVPNVEGAIQVLEEDPEDASRIVLTYSGTSVLKSDVSWAVEFLWPAGRGIEASGADASDLFNLRAAYADVITARADKIFDYSDEEDGSYLTPAHLLAAVGTSTDSDSWEPATDERGDIARALFYMDVRYNGTEANTTDLVLENQIGNPEDMAVLTTLLEWHHADPVNEAERLRNHRIYTLYQQNRNPFIDHPIYADLIFGDFVAQAQDLDLDGIPTYWEVAHQQDPEDPTDAGEDTDGDGFSNFEEYWMGTDPNSASDPVTLHVDAVYTGSVQNGTATHPYKTIQAAANAVPENQLRAILVNPGTYLGPYITGKKKIHLFSEQGAAATVIEANPTNSSVVRLYDFERASLVGFTIRDAVTTWYGAGVRIDAPAGKLLLANNIITNNTTTNTTTGGGGVYLKTATGSRMVNNIIFGNSAVRGGGVLFAGGNTEFWHNTIANNAATGGNGGGLSAIQGVIPDVRNNILWQNTGNGANAQLHQIPAATSNLVQNAAPNSGNIDADPLFVDPANGDYHITANSPARNTAIPLGLAEDIDLDPRSDTTDGQKDIGADEIVSLDPEPTPTPTPEPTPEPTPPPFIDTDGNGIDDNWELEHFGHLGVDPGGDVDGDGMSNLQEYQHGSDPNDFWNGNVPVLVIIDGNNQGGLPNTILARPLAVKVANQYGIPKPNTVVTFSIESGEGLLIPVNNGITDSDGIARANLELPPSVGVVIVIRSLTGNIHGSIEANFTATVGNPNASPKASGRAVVVLSEDESEAFITWEDRSNNETAYLIDRTEDGENWMQLAVLAANTTSYTDTNLVPGRGYGYRVTAYNNTLSTEMLVESARSLGGAYKDSDQDGLSDDVEAFLKQDPNRKQPVPPAYAIVDLLDGTGENAGYPIDLNDSSQALIQGESGMHYRWTNGNAAALSQSEAQGGGIAAQAVAISNSGAVVGTIVEWVDEEYYNPLPAIWQPNASSPIQLTLPDLEYELNGETYIGGPDPSFGRGEAISAGGNGDVIYGYTSSLGMDAYGRENRAIFSSHQWMNPLQEPQRINPPTKPWSGVTVIGASKEGNVPFGINNGQENPAHTWWAGMPSTYIPFIPLGANSTGETVGHQFDGDLYHAKYWNKTSTMDLGKGTASSINDSRQIVGSGSGGALLWIWDAEQNKHVKYDLNKWMAVIEGRMDESELPYTINYAQQVNKHGCILVEFQSPLSDWNYFPMLLVPVDMAVDANRDGFIRFAGNYNDSSVSGKPMDTTSEAKPFRFWINNDQDTNTATTPDKDAEVVPATTADYSDNQIKTRRDLEDFTLLALNVGAFYDEIANGTFKVGLKWKGTGTPKIKVYRSANADGVESDGTSYLNDDGQAAAQIAGAYGNALGEVSGTSPLILPSDFWTGYSEENPKRFLLFEGSGEGKGQLVMTIHKSDGTLLGEGGGVWLDLVNVRKMYLRVKATGIADNFAEPSQTTPCDPPEPTMGFEEDPNGNAFDENAPVSWQQTKDYIVFVHGWNMSYEGSQKFAETMFKRLWQRGYKGRYAFMRWPTMDDSFGIGSFQVPYTYNASEYRAWKSGESLKQFMGSLPSGYTKNLVTHSMGGIVGGSALQKGMSLNNYALCNAAVPAACYDDSSTLDQGWGYTTPHYDPDAGTRNLSYRYKLNSVGGNLINFYLAGDSALEKWELNNYTSGPFSLGAKPQRYNVGTTGYYYDPGASAGLRLGINYQTAVGRLISDPHEAMAYVAQSPTKTVGADGRTGGSIDGSVDLSGYGFGTVHSAEFTFTLQKSVSFYNELLFQFDITPLP